MHTENVCILHIGILYSSKCCTNLIKYLQIKNRLSSLNAFCATPDGTGHIPRKTKRLDKNASSVKARSGAGVVHADLVSPAGNAGLWLQWGSALAAAELGAGGSLQAARGVAEVGGWPVVGGQARLLSQLGILEAGMVQVLGHSGCLAWTVVRCLALLLLLLSRLLAFLLVGLFDITVMCTGNRKKESRCW